MLHIREIAASDLDVIAALHAHSWRTSYRGILRDSYLDDSIFEERLALWRDRLLIPTPEQLGLLAQSSASVIGFVFAFVAHDDRWGTLIDNLHVAPECRGKGVGTQLLAALTDSLLHRAFEDGIHLWVFEANHRTRQYYERLGAKAVESAVVEAPGGGQAAACLYAWRSVSQLSIAVRS